MEYRFHPLADIFPMLPYDELQALADDIAANGLHEPVVLFEGAILDGRNRYAACIAAGLPCEFSEYTGTDPLAYVVSLNLKRRHLNESQRAMVAARLANMPKGRPSENASIEAFSQPVAADLLNVSRAGVQRARGVLDHGEPELIDAVDRGDIAVSRADAIARNTPREEQAAVVAALPHVARNSGNNEWYTPEPYILAALAVMGRIDLDPASTLEANTVVGAGRFYTAEDDGLAQEWGGRVWMNPPYAAGLIDKFASKLVRHAGDGDVTEACVLVNNATDTAWFRELIGVAGAVCFTFGRVRFWEPGGRQSAPLQGQAVIYIGQNIETFRAAFGSLGWTATL